MSNSVFEHCNGVNCAKRSKQISNTIQFFNGTKRKKRNNRFKKNDMMWTKGDWGTVMKREKKRAVSRRSQKREEKKNDASYRLWVHIYIRTPARTQYTDYTHSLSLGYEIRHTEHHWAKIFSGPPKLLAKHLHIRYVLNDSQLNGWEARKRVRAKPTAMRIPKICAFYTDESILTWDGYVAVDDIVVRDVKLGIFRLCIFHCIPFQSEVSKRIGWIKEKSTTDTTNHQHQYNNKESAEIPDELMKD